jgi:hypothetical protein
MHALISQHESILNELKEEHNRQLKAAEVKASSQTEKEVLLCCVTYNGSCISNKFYLYFLDRLP